MVGFLLGNQRPVAVIVWPGGYHLVVANFRFTRHEYTTDDNGYTWAIVLRLMPLLLLLPVAPFMTVIEIEGFLFAF